MTVVHDLLDLQRIEIDLEARQGALVVIDHQLAEDDGLDEKRSELEDARKALRALETTERDLELKDGELSEHLAVMEKKLYSGRVGNPKELSSLNDDVVMLKRQRAELDDRVLGLMEEVEAARANVAQAQDDLAGAEAAYIERRSRLQRDRESTIATVAALTARRETRLGTLPPDARERYQAVRARKRPAIAVVERGICGSCRVEVLDQLVKAAQREIALCNSCSRILYVA
ncbi:MAG: hypothetical protein WEB00_08150 [Dehalococcoidia bacterium]